jgi:hypothetical protein
MLIPSVISGMLHPAFLTSLYRRIVGIRLAQPLAIYPFSSNFLYRPPRCAIIARVWRVARGSRALSSSTVKDPPFRLSGRAGADQTGL